MRGQILHLRRFVGKLKRKVFLVECEGLSAKVEFFVGTTNKLDLLAFCFGQASGFYLDFLCFCLAFHQFISFFSYIRGEKLQIFAIGKRIAHGLGKAICKRGCKLIAPLVVWVSIVPFDPYEFDLVGIEKL